MNISRSGINLIKHHEGWRDHVYLDSAGLPTIGYGHLIKSGESFTTITYAQGEQLLIRDVRTAVDAVNSLVNVPISQNQFDSLVSFTYNVGAGAFARSTMLDLINAGELQQAAAEFKRWNQAGGQVVAGLVSRRQSEAALFLS